jgi:phosphatidylglycerol:prolipoprotein diacylglycerol transferase
MSGSPLYAMLSALAIVVSAIVWSRLLGRQSATRDGRLALVFIATLLGAFVGAKLAFLAAEGWNAREDLVALLTGRSVTGALIGGTLAAEFIKSRLGVVTATGDAFAITVPLAVAIGRIGCISAGCCQGVECDPSWWTVVDGHGHARVPSAQLELGFNAVFLAWVFVAAARGWMPTQRFNIYLIAYGLFRFVHEYWRDDHRWLDGFGGYHAAAILLVILGLAMFRRRKALAASRPPQPIPARNEVPAGG